MVEQTQNTEARQQLADDSDAIIARFRTEYLQGRIPGVPYRPELHLLDIRKPQVSFRPILSVDPQQWSCKIRWLIPALRADQSEGPAEEVRGEKDFKLAVVGTEYVPMTQNSNADSQAQPQAQHSGGSLNDCNCGSCTSDTQND